MPRLDLPSAIAASTSRSRGVSSSSGPRSRRRPSIRPTICGIERAAARRDALDGVDERGHVADALLEQVADALGASRRSGRARRTPRRTATARARRCPAGGGAAPCAATRPSSSRRGGICTSTTATSGRWASALRSRSSASPACATTSHPASASSRTMPSRMSTSSSPITTRSGSGTRTTVSWRRRSGATDQARAATRRAARPSGRSPTAPMPARGSAVRGVGVRGDQHDARAPRQGESRCASANPSPSGRPMSTSTASGRSAVGRSSASANVAASPTTT